MTLQRYAGRRRFKGWKGKFMAMMVPIVLLLVLEAFLRVFTGAPHGQFVTWFPGKKGLYPENATVEMTWGAIPYVMHVNSLGLRGPEPSGDADAILIAAVGDSYTDGFFVDDEDTYPVILQKLLRECGIKSDVLNAARAGGSIDKELAILREVVLPLRPKVVILQFCTNDIFELAGKSRAEMLSYQLKPPFRLHRDVARLLLTHTALGELAYGAWLSLTHKDYREARAKLAPGAKRFPIQGGTNFAANSQLFMERFGKTDGLVLVEPFTRETQALVGDYLAVFEEFKRQCDSIGASLLFVYEPAYPQVYDPQAVMTVRDQMEAKCVESGVEFVDLTPAFQHVDKESPMHLAPVDFHLNRQGNHITASCVAKVLTGRFE